MTELIIDIVGFDTGLYSLGSCGGLDYCFIFLSTIFRINGIFLIFYIILYYMTGI